MSKEEYIKNSSKSFKHSFKERSLGNIQVFIKDYLPNSFDLDLVFKELKDKVPYKFLKYIDYIFIGQFQDLIKTKTQAKYLEGAIYVTNEQDTEQDMTDDLVHEVAHAVEEEEFLSIYSDGSLESEFLGKRERLFHLLDTEGLNVDYSEYKNPEYTRSFDDHLYFEIGYPYLTNISVNLFYSPYAITSLREYFANGFEAYYYHRDHQRLSTVSPVLFSKIEEINEDKEN